MNAVLVNGWLLSAICTLLRRQKSLDLQGIETTLLGRSDSSWVDVPIVLNFIFQKSLFGNPNFKQTAHTWFLKVSLQSTTENLKTRGCTPCSKLILLVVNMPSCCGHGAVLIPSFKIVNVKRWRSERDETNKIRGNESFVRRNQLLIRPRIF
jgi:hypothetical protein